MYIRSIVGFFLLLAAGQPAWAAPKETVLAPSSPWNLDASPSGCALRRSFGTGTPPLVLEMNRNAPSNDFEFIVSGTEIGGFTQTSRLFVRFGGLPRQQLYFKPGITARSGVKEIPTIFATAALEGRDVPRTDAQASLVEDGATKVALETGNKSVILTTGSLAKPFALMRQCTSALVQSWGLDPEEQRLLSRRLEPIALETWGNQIRDGSAVGNDGRQARVNFRLIVDRNGVPSDCKVLRSYNEPAFDAAACRMLKRIARFKPALDRSGTPVASYFTSTVIWSTG